VQKSWCQRDLLICFHYIILNWHDCRHFVSNLWMITLFCLFHYFFPLHIYWFSIVDIVVYRTGRCRWLRGTFWGCHSTVRRCRSSDHSLVLCTQTCRSTVCWQCEARQWNSPSTEDLSWLTQALALLSRTDQSSFDRSEHSTSLLRHRHDNAAGKLHRYKLREFRSLRPNNIWYKQLNQ